MDELKDKTWTDLMRRIDLEEASAEMKQAFVHPTYALEAGGIQPDNQRLEFLGDAVLGLIVGEMLFRQHPEKKEGELSSIRSVAVSEPTLSNLARELSFPNLLLLGKGEERSGGRYRTSTLADAFEAFLGGLYVTAGFEAVQEFLCPLMQPVLQEIISVGYKDPKTTLQEIVQNKFKRNISYRLLEERGPDHEKEFTCGVVWKDEIVALGRGMSKKEAQRQAAMVAIEYFNSQI